MIKSIIIQEPTYALSKVAGGVSIADGIGFGMPKPGCARAAFGVVYVADCIPMSVLLLMLLLLLLQPASAEAAALLAVLPPPSLRPTAPRAKYGGVLKSIVVGAIAIPPIIGGSGACMYLYSFIDDMLSTCLANSSEANTSSKNEDTDGGIDVAAAAEAAAPPTAVDVATGAPATDRGAGLGGEIIFRFLVPTTTPSTIPPNGACPWHAAAACTSKTSVPSLRFTLPTSLRGLQAVL